MKTRPITRQKTFGLRPRKECNYNDSKPRNATPLRPNASGPRKTIQSPPRTTHSAKKCTTRTSTRSTKHAEGGTKGLHEPALKEETTPTNNDIPICSPGSEQATTAELDEHTAQQQAASETSAYDDTIATVIERSSTIDVRWKNQRPVKRPEHPAVPPPCIAEIVEAARNATRMRSNTVARVPRRSATSKALTSVASQLPGPDNSLCSGIPHIHLAAEVFRDPQQEHNALCDPRAEFSIKTLGDALFGEDTVWNRNCRRSYLSSENLVFRYGSARWKNRETVWVPYGKSTQPGDVPYTCATCFRYGSYLKGFKEVNKKLPVVIVRQGRVLDDPDWPPIEHICDSSKMSEEHRAALGESGIQETLTTLKDVLTPPVIRTVPFSARMHHNTVPVTTVNNEMTIGELLSQHREELLYSAKERAVVRDRDDSYYRGLLRAQSALAQAPCASTSMSPPSDVSYAIAISQTPELPPSATAYDDEGMVNVNDYLMDVVNAAVANNKDSATKTLASIKKEVEECYYTDATATAFTGCEAFPDGDSPNDIRASSCVLADGSRSSSCPWKINQPEIEQAALLIRDAMRYNEELLAKYDDVMSQFSLTNV